MYEKKTTKKQQIGWLRRKKRLFIFDGCSQALALGRNWRFFHYEKKEFFQFWPESHSLLEERPFKPVVGLINIVYSEIFKLINGDGGSPLAKGLIKKIKKNMTV